MFRENRTKVGYLNYETMADLLYAIGTPHIYQCIYCSICDVYLSPGAPENIIDWLAKHKTCRPSDALALEVIK